MISGLWWHFEIMPNSLKKIGEHLPIRWAMFFIENIKNGYSFEKLMQ